MKNDQTKSMGFFNDYAIANNKMHPIAQLFYDAMTECEKLPASEQQTATVIAIGKCKDAVEMDLQLLTMIAYPITRFDNDADVEGAISDYLSDTNGEFDSHSLTNMLKESFSIYKKDKQTIDKTTADFISGATDAGFND